MIAEAETPLGRAARWLRAATLICLPGAFVPHVFYEPFVQSHRLALIVLGIPALVLSRICQRGASGAASALRWPIHLAAACGAAVTLFRAPAAWPSLVPFLITVLGYEVFLEIGGAEASRGLEGRQRVMRWLLLGAVPVLLVGWARRHWGWFDFVPDRGDAPIGSTLGNGNALGEFAAPLAVLALPSLTRWRSPLALVLGLAPWLLLVLCDSRGAALATLVGLVVALAFALRWFRTGQRGPLVLTGALLLSSLVALVTLGSLRDRALTVFDANHPTNLVRRSLWSGALSLASDHAPLGVGAGRFEAAFVPYRGAAEWTLSGADSRADDPHQEGLWMLAELGVFGALACSVCAASVSLALLRLRDAPDRPWLIGALLATLVTATIRSPFHHLPGLMPFAVLCGLVGHGSKSRPASRRWWMLGAIVPTAAGVGLILELSADHATRVAIHRMEELRAAQLTIQPDGEKLRSLLELAARDVRAAANTRLRAAHRDHRVAQDARELTRLRNGLLAKNLTNLAEGLPDRSLVDGLLLEVRRLAPNHPGAMALEATLELDHGHVAAAVHRLEDALERVPNAPRFRTNLAVLRLEGGDVADAWRLTTEECRLAPRAAEATLARRGRVALRLGADAGSFGVFLPNVAEFPHRVLEHEGFPVFPLLDRSAPPSDQWQRALARLGARPLDLDALSTLAELSFGPMREDADALADGNRAVARTKMIFAAEAWLSGDRASASTNARLGARKDGRLLDAGFLLLIAALTERDLESAERALASLAPLDEAILRNAVRRSDPNGSFWDDARVSRLFRR